MARHRRTLHWGLLATVWCSVAASVVPYWSGTGGLTRAIGVEGPCNDYRQVKGGIE